MFYAFSEAAQPFERTSPTPPYPACYWGDTVKPLHSPWTLTLTGLQGETLSLSLTDLDMFPQKTYERRWVTHAGWSVRATWEGVLLQHLIEKLRPPAGQTLYVRQGNVHGFSESLPLKEVLLHRALLVRKVNGEALPALYGGPLHIKVFHCYGYKGLHQVISLSLSTTPVYEWSHHLGESDTGEFVPGQYYAWDLKENRLIKRTTEVEDY